MLESRLNFYIDFFYHTTPYVNNFNRNTQVERRVNFHILIVVGHSTKVWNFCRNILVCLWFRIKCQQRFCTSFTKYLFDRNKCFTVIQISQDVFVFS